MAQCISSETSLSKVKYKTRREAKIALRNFANKHNMNRSEFDVYRCDQCRWVHFGRTGGRQGPPLHQLPRERMAFLYTTGVRVRDLAEAYRVKDVEVLREWLRPFVEEQGGVMA